MPSPFAKLAADICGFADPNSGLCPICRCPKPETTTHDALSQREFEISGLCQQCQDRTFAADKDKR